MIFECFLFANVCPNFYLIIDLSVENIPSMWKGKRRAKIVVKKSG
jgi:hypothetical protein